MMNNYHTAPTVCLVHSHTPVRTLGTQPLSLPHCHLIEPSCSRKIPQVPLHWHMFSWNLLLCVSLHMLHFCFCRNFFVSLSSCFSIFLHSSCFLSSFCSCSLDFSFSFASFSSFCCFNASKTSTSVMHLAFAFIASFLVFLQLVDLLELKCH